MRPVFRNEPSTTPSNSNTVQLTCHFDNTSGTEFILWDDIKVVFAEALYVRYDSRILPFMKDCNFRNLDPFRIAAIPDATLEIVLEERMTPSAVGAPQAVLRQQQQQQVTVDTGFGAGPTHTPVGLDYAPPPYTPPTHQQSDPLTTSSANNLSGALFDGTPLPTMRITLQSSQEASVDEIVDRLGMTNIGSTAGQGSLVTSEQGGITHPRERLPVAEDASAVNADRQETSEAEETVRYLTTPNQTRDDGIDKDRFRQSFKPVFWYLGAAHGDIKARNTVGVLCEMGLEGRQDYKRAMGWYLKAAEQGYAPAQCNVGLLYAQGFGVPRDYFRAMEWCLLAAEQGHAQSQFNIAVMYDDGSAVSQSDAKAVDWYLLAADQGYVHAQYKLGIIYHDGQGVVARDHSKALEWFLKAAKQGHPDAQLHVGIIYEFGEGLAQPDLAQAFEWYRKAADQGMARAERKIELLCMQGIVVRGGRDGQELSLDLERVAERNEEGVEYADFYRQLENAIYN
ncbi:hypothetical protein BGX29_005489 [Mortierella sp. GBA35]|nr:hypothetical protein BGX29_005489 [Mortierella sp. GBA35]